MSQNVLGTPVEKTTSKNEPTTFSKDQVSLFIDTTLDFTVTDAPEVPRGKKKRSGHAHARAAPKPRTPLKKDTWFLDDKIKRMEDAQRSVKRPAIHDAYSKKLQKLASLREKELIGKSFKRWKKESEFKMQSGIEGALFGLSDKIMDPEVCDLAEDVLLLTYDLMRSRSVLDYTMAAVSFAKKRIPKDTLKAARAAIVSFIADTIKATDFMTMQSGTEKLANARDTLKMWPRLKASPLWRKVNSVIIFATSMTLFGSDTTRAKALRVEEHFYSSRSMLQADFVYNVLDLLLFVAERGIQVIQSKKIDPMFHSGGAYEKWYDEANDIISKANFLANPKAHGIDIHTFTNTLDKLIANGQSMYKYSCELDKTAKGLIRGTTNQLLNVRASYLNRKVAQQTRAAPLALIVEGHSSVAKTTFSNLLHYYYGSLMSKDLGPGSRYTRMTNAVFWDGFSTDQWSLLIDDAGSVNPSVMQGLDPSIAEIFLCINNAPFVPDMAKLEDKGAAPFMCDLVVITTNTPDLNFDHYFNCPGAAARRVPFHIRVRPKAELKKNATMIDEARLEQLEPGFYPDWWNIEILMPVLVPSSDDKALEFKMSYKLETVGIFDNMSAFLQWYRGVIEKHVSIQDRMATSEEAFRMTKLCTECRLPTGMCGCVEVPEANVDLATAFDQMVGPEDDPFPAPAFSMQAGEEFSPFEMGTYPVLPTSRPQGYGYAIGQFIGYAIMNMVFAGLNSLTYGITLSIALLLWHFRSFIILLINTPRFEVMQIMTRFLLLRAYYGACDYVNDKTLTVRTGVVDRSRAARDAMRRCGERVAETYFRRSRLVKLIIVVLTIALAGFAAYKMFSNTPSMSMQGNVLDSIGVSPKPGSEAASVWVRDAYTPTAFDIGRRSLSWKTMDDAEVQKILSKNCAFIRFWTGDHWRVAKCVGLGGQFFMTTGHSVPQFQERIKCQLVRSPQRTGPTGNVDFLLSAKDVKRDMTKDIVIFKCGCVPPLRDITDLFVREKLVNFRANGYYLARTTEGTISTMPVTGIHEKPYYNPGLAATTQVWFGTCAMPTVLGDCGSVLVARSGSGPVLLGLHQLGKGTSVGAIKTTYETIMTMLDGALIVSDSPPMLDAPTTNVGHLTDVHVKSPINFIEGGNVDCYGSFEGFRPASKFNVQPSIMAPFLETQGFKIEHCAPKAKGWEPKYETLKELSYVDANVKSDIVEQAAAGYLEDILKVSDRWTKEIVVYDVHTAVNGVPGLRYVDGIKRGTSAGFPYLKPKEHFLEQLEPTEDYPDHVKLVPMIEDRVEIALDRMQNSEVPGCVFRASHKNEALPIEKAKKGKVRTFQMAPIELTVIMRMYTLFFVRIAQSNHWRFECGPGLEAQSCEWDFLYQFLTQFGTETCIFADFKGFDRSMHPVFILQAFYILADFVERKTGDKKHAHMIRVLAFEIAFAYVDFFGDLVRLYGKNPSGQALTALINGIVNSTYHRYAYIHCNPHNECTSFQRYVALITYGDDKGSGVSKLIPWFNHSSIKAILAEIGVTYTMADKESESVPYINISEGSFLKRSWRWCPETGTMVAPLELASMSKMLMVSIPSKVVSPEVQAVDTIRSANSEFFWHGREVFNKYHAIMLQLVDHLELGALMIPDLEDWETLLERYKENSRAYLARVDNPKFVSTENYTFLAEHELQAGRECSCGPICGLASMDDEDVRVCGRCGFLTFDDLDIDCYHCHQQDRCSLCHVMFEEGERIFPSPEGYTYRCQDCVMHGLYSQLCTRCGRQDCHRYMMGNDYDFRLCEFCGRCVIAEEGFLSCPHCFLNGDPTIPTHSMGFREMSRYIQSQITDDDVNPPTRPAVADVEHAIDIIAETPASLPTIGALSERENGNPPSPRAGIREVNQSSNNQTEEQAQYQLQSGVEYGAPPTIGSDVQVAEHASSERVQTARFVDSTQGEVLEFANPESRLFTYDKQSNAELGDFLSRPRLIKTVTWTPGVLSNSTFDPWTLYLNTTEIKYKLNNYAFLRGNLRVKVVVNAAPFYYGALLMYYTPMPNQVLGLSSTTGVKIQQSQRPHIWIMPQKNEGGEMLLPFFFHKNYVDITSASEVATLGNLTLTQYTNLASANGASSNGVQMQFYAWMEDATLFGPTVSLAMQAGDEYGNGPVSGPASAVAHWATYLSRVPYIGRFAKATGIGASATSQVAKLFGWSNVPVIEDVRPLKNVPFHDLASSHISEPTSKFTLDPKGELSVDPALVGLGREDEMSIAHLCAKESYLATGTWTAGGTAGALIFSSRVTPVLGERGTVSAGGTYTLCLTPMSWVSANFMHWHGDIIFRFKVICSQYHSGRLRIHWDPLGDLSATTDYTHITYTSIIDLQESDEAEFRVPYMQALAWLPLDRPHVANNWSTTATMANTASYNGTLTLRVLNNLTAPVDTATCSVLVFVRAAENLEFANPRDITSRYTFFNMQSGVEPASSNAPFEERYLLNWGEAIPSLRLLLRRSVLIDRITAPAITATDEAGVLSVYQTRLPPTPGYDPNAYTAAKGVETPATTYKFSYTTMTSLGWTAAAFVAMRGSTRWHYNMVNPDGSLSHDIAVVRRTNTAFAANDQGLECKYTTGGSSAATTQSLLKGYMWVNFEGTQGQSGVALTNPNTQTGVGVEYPMMSNYLFQYANPRNWLLGNSTDGTDLDNYRIDVNIHPAAGTGFRRAQLYRYAAAGTDFTLHYFLNTPTVGFNPTIGNVPA